MFSLQYLLLMYVISCLSLEEVKENVCKRITDSLFYVLGTLCISALGKLKEFSSEFKQNCRLLFITSLAAKVYVE